jgi:hypothetical protein
MLYFMPPCYRKTVGLKFQRHSHDNDNNAAAKVTPSTNNMDPTHPNTNSMGSTNNPSTEAENVPHNDQMGPQSQRRNTLQERTHQLQGQNKGYKKRSQPTQQITLAGERAFDPIKDCPICKAREGGYSEPHRGHHPLCWNNKRTKGLSPATLASIKESKRLEAFFAAKPQKHEIFSSRNNSRAACIQFFAPRKTTKQPPATSNKSKSPAPPMKPSPTTTTSFTEEMFTVVATRTSEEDFRLKHQSKEAPLALIALASFILEKMNSSFEIFEHVFDGITMTIPGTESMHNNVHYHSIVGQKLILVDWKRTHCIEIPCGCSGCPGVLRNTRTNFSKNQTLFPIFNIDGPPTWCVVQSLKCDKCSRRVFANDGEVLCRLPMHVAALYPVDSKFAGNRNSHVGRSATDIFDQIMTTYGNGDLCSRLLYNALNRCYLERVASYYSYWKHNKERNKSITKYLEKDNEYIRSYPPLGSTIRDLYDDACKSSYTHWNLSDHDRHVREIQSVSCRLTIAQDHTFDVIKNYQHDKLGAVALWDCATESGEIASAVLVPTTKTKHFAHAAQMLAARKNFKPKVMYSDTWPAKSDFWPLIFDQTEFDGRLGLFHFIQRITRTLRKKHLDYNECLRLLLDAIYAYHPGDLESVIRALREGTLGNKVHSEREIADLRSSGRFRQRYGKFIRKIIRQPLTMIQKLDDWFVRFKVTSSPGAREPMGRLDPRTQLPIFTEDTKPAVENCKLKAEYLSDPLPLEDMYVTIPPSPNSKHNLPQFLSRRVESKLESFHDNLSHFANCGMRSSLSDNLNLAGTARYNLAIRRRVLLSQSQENPELIEQRKKIPAAWEDTVDYYNHSELHYVNKLAVEVAGEKSAPFKNIELLQPDTGERFFSEYLTSTSPTKQYYDANDRCLCRQCRTIRSNKQNTASIDNESSQNESQPNPPLSPPKNASTPPAVHATRNPPLPAPPQTPKSPPTNTAPSTIQQAQPQQPQPQAIMNYGYANTHLPYPNCAPMLVAPLMMSYPFFGNVATSSFNALSLVNTPFCCQQYLIWFQQPDRMGRPPHDPHCRNRKTKKK